MRILYFLMFTTLLSCHKIGETATVSVKVKTSDTLFGPRPKGKNCVAFQGGFSKKLGICVSDFYQISDIKYTSENDSVAVLIPKNPAENHLYYCFSDEDLRLVLLVFNKEKSSTKIYSKVFYNDSPNIFQEINTAKKGFQISYDIGNSSKILVETFVSQNKIDSINIEAWGFEQYRKTYFFKNFNLAKYSTKTIDSLVDLKGH